MTTAVPDSQRNVHTSAELLGVVVAGPVLLWLAVNPGKIFEGRTRFILGAIGVTTIVVDAWLLNQWRKTKRDPS